MRTLPKVIKFPTKRQRRSYQKKIFSMYTLHEVTNVTVGVLVAQVITYVWNILFF